MKPFLIAALALAAGPALAQSQGHAGHHAATPAAADAVGVVKSVDTRKAAVTIAHEAIPALGWPAMTMSFKVADPALLKGVSAGQKVDFQLQDQTIVAIKPSTGAP